MLKVVLLLMIGLAACAPTQNEVELPILKAGWLRPAAADGVSAGYLTIENPGAAVLRLVAVESAAAAEVQLHETVVDGDVVRMRAVDVLEIAPGETTVLEPGGLHLMVMNLQAPLVAGDQVTLEFQFETAGDETITSVLEVPVQAG